MKKIFFWKRILLFVVFSILLLTSLAGAAIYTFANKIHTPIANSIPIPAQAATSVEIPPAAQADSRINILLLGVDDGDPDIPDSPRRSDTIMVASVNFESKAIHLLSVPRDSRVKIPGHPGYDKITHAYFYGGPALAVATVQNLLHIPIDYYITIDWKSFIKVVDILGGVTLNVEHDMDYEDPYEQLSIHLTKGNQHLDGEKSGQYIRFRHDELGDIGRVERQQHFLKALYDKMLQSNTLLKLPSLLATISNYLHTDMNLYTLGKIGNVLRDMKLDSLQTATLPGDFATIDEISYWLPNQDKIQKFSENISN